MVKFTIEEIRTLMDYKHNIRNMSGAPPWALASAIRTMAY